MYKRQISVFTRTLNVKTTLEAAEKDRLVEIANKCPVHKMLEHGNIVETRLG